MIVISDCLFEPVNCVVTYLQFGVVDDPVKSVVQSRMEYLFLEEATHNPDIEHFEQLLESSNDADVHCRTGNEGPCRENHEILNMDTNKLVVYSTRNNSHKIKYKKRESFWCRFRLSR